MKWPDTFTGKEELINVVIETPYKSRNKFELDKKTGLYKLSKVLPAGLAFPCDMGFIPHTRGNDGDPLDALILMDELTFPGSLVECRVVGVIRATQKEEKGKEVQNDRYITVPDQMKDCDHIKHYEDISKHKIQAIIDFFKDYNAFDHKKFTVSDILGPNKAIHLIKKQRI